MMADTTQKSNGVAIEEVMRSDAATIPTHATMQQTAQILLENRQHGACVVDEFGYCVGVVTAWDFVLLEQNRESVCDVGGMGTVHELVKAHAQGPYSLDSSDYDDVRRHMSPFVQTIERHASVTQAAHIMNDLGIHQLVVLDENNRPVGLVDSNDLVAFVHPRSTDA